MPTQITLNQLLIIGAVIGFIFGLAPLILGLRKQNRKFAFLGFVLTVLAGIFFSLLGALPVAAVFTWLILKKPAATPTVQTEAVNENSADEAGIDSENS
jgi:hypothetical protein